MVKRTKEINIIFRLTKEDAREFKAQCALEGKSMQDVLERLIKEYLKSAKKKAE